MEELHSEKYASLTLWLTVAFGLAVIALAVIGPVWVGRPVPWAGVSSVAFVVALAVGMIVRRKLSPHA